MKAGKKVKNDLGLIACLEGALTKGAKLSIPCATSEQAQRKLGR